MKKTVMVVDDEENVRSLISEILRMAGFHVIEATDGQHALRELETQNVDLLITDRNMPRLDGLELLKELQRQKRSIPAIVISAYGEDSLWGEAIGSGAVDYLLKPFTNEAVIAVVHKTLSGGSLK